MLNFMKEHHLLLLIPSAFLLYFIAFQNTAIFWYMYTFALLLLMSYALLFTKIFDELPTWKSLLFGLGYGTLIYGLIAGSYGVLQLLPFPIEDSISNFLENFAPISIWHYLLLMFIIVPGEEIFWRGYVQQKLKKYMPASFAILTSSVLFGLALGLGEFIPGMLAAAAAGMILGALYEWKRSMPLLIITHLVMVILLFLVKPLQ
ncbi:hypothetical protein HNQ44_000487 [Planomicrobium koreense]|uniref:CAAX prenyl protease 2/Lysostaphin resistance protein A-like domain-containing protein n=1 Tax=Planococcus koreensis TaxID=112331 RepID=A0A7W8FT17_9BACL|nr:type II CAAX endopeptidase family protein [Planococcus koreensis]MBB5179065.1 hypothetical protein [Planococcus koreensis]